MSINLRPYQQEFVNKIRASIKQYKQILACSATGSGKSKTFISIAHGSINHGRTVLIISESTKIYGQIHKEIGNTTNIGDGVDEFYVEPNKIYVAMSQTLVRRPGLIEQFKLLGDKLLIIADEAHIGTMTNLLKQFENAYLIGFTATPDYRKAKHLPEIYKDCVIGPQPQELVEMGYLSPYYHFERQVVDIKSLKKSSTGDFTEESQERAFEKTEVFEGILDDLKKFKFHKCMIFCASIKHCRDVVQKLRILYNVSECHSKNPNSDYELFEFTNGSNNICVSVGSLTKGFDEPAIDLVILNRATTSLPTYLQMCGRGSRIFVGKFKFTVIDYGMNGTRHKPWNYEHDWANMWKGSSKKSDGVAPIKICPNCGFMMHVNVPICPECETEMKSVKEEKTPKETVLVEITEKYNALRGRKISTLTPLELHQYVQMTNKKAFAKRIARSKGNDFLSKYATLAKWKYGWWKYIEPDQNIEFADIEIK